MQEPLALVGMACRLPGGDGLEEFWRLVSTGSVAWGPLPAERLNRDLYFEPGKGKTGKSYSELGGLVSARRVDQTVCPLTADMVERYDIAHQIFLEVASQACRDAGLDPFSMPTDRATGVYVGHTGGSSKVGDCVYSTRIDEAATLLGEVEAANELLGSGTAELAAELTAAVRARYPGRQAGQPAQLSALGAAQIVREALRLEGPYLVVDAACASSLQALAIAARALASGSIDQAIVGGASYCKSDSLVLFSAAQSVSNSGSCPFGRAADGLVTAEGYVALVLKTLSRAEADGDRIRAVIRGIGVASDGKGKSLWAPRQEGQTLAVQRAYPALTDLAELDYIEAHATSTQVGDATELGALAGLMKQYRSPGHQIPIGSVKANVGHTLETAGLASLVKVVLAMEHGTIPPGTTATDLNDQFDWQQGPFRVPRAPEPWPPHAAGQARQAAVNAFGIGGLNVHVALAEYQPCGTRSGVIPVPAAEPVAIVGAGCVLPGGLNLPAFEAMLDEGRSAVGPVPADRWTLERAVDPAGPRSWHTTAGLGGFIEGFQYDWRRHKVPPKQIAAANPLQFMLLEAADAALADAGFSEDSWDRTRVSVVVGTMFGGEFSHDLQVGLRLPETTQILRRLLQERGLSAAACDAVVDGYERKVLQAMPALVDETGSFTSSTLASRLTKSFNLMGGALALDAGDCSSTTAIAAAIDMLREGSCDAVVCAAGQRYLDLVAFEMLSLRGSLATSRRTLLDGDGDGRIPGEGAVVLVLKRLQDAEASGDRIRGVIRAGVVSAGEHPDQTAARVVRRAVADAEVPPNAIVAAEVSGVCHRRYDEPLFAAVAGGLQSARPVAVGALDATIGHVGAAAGAAGILKLSRAVATGGLPATAGLPADRLIADALRAVGRPQELPAASPAGYRAGLVTEMHDDLVGQIILDNGLPLPHTGRGPITPGADVSPTASPLIPEAAARPLIAAIFPGQGSQWTGMFRDFAEQTPEGRAALTAINQLADRSGQPRLADVAWSEVNSLGTGVWETQWSVYLADLFAWTVLKNLGFAPDVIASHSFGEFPALVAAGGWTAETGAVATRARATAVDQFGPQDGAMLSLQADRSTVETLIAPLHGRIWRCAENAPEQTVVGGSARVIDAAELLLEPTKVRSKRLAVPSPFHTPLLAAAAAELAKALAALPIMRPELPIVSSTTVGRLESAEAIRESLIRQMTETVRWVELVEQLYAAGVRTFVEVGPSSVLSGLTRRILAERPDITIVQFDQRGRSPAEQLVRLQQALGLGAGKPTSPAVAGFDSLTSTVSPGRIVSFDATARRRERNRASAHGTAQVAVAVGSATVATRNGNGHAGGGNGVVGQRQTFVEPENGKPGGNSLVLGGRLAKDATQPPADPVAATDADTHLSEPPGQSAAVAGELEAFLVDFVVEQTGYPQEIVELDADLEADLGIDSIRKAQLFGEIGQKYGLAADNELSLDDFPTLRHLLDYMVRRLGGNAAVEIGAAEDRVSQPVATVAVRQEAAAAAATPPATVAVAADPAVPADSAAGSVAADELSAFLVDFVIEQTGYPREIVELDADLEADLGIDSIRKAQLFGEIGQKYGLAADDALSLDDFPTLRHLLDYILPRAGDGGVAAAAETPAEHESEVYRSDAFRVGEERGGRFAEAIRRWTRLVPAVDGVVAPIFPRALGEELDGLAAGAGVSAEAVRAAMANPTAVFGGFEAIVSQPEPHPGLLLSFGRQLPPAVETSETAAGRSSLIGLPGLPGAVVGWNTAGVVAWIGSDGRSPAGNLRAATPAATAVAEIVRSARTLAEAVATLRERAPLDGPVHLLGLADGSPARVATDGTLATEAGAVAVDPTTTLSRVACNDGQRQPGEAIDRLLADTPADAARLSAAVHWLALGHGAEQVVVRGGGPVAGWFDPDQIALPEVAPRPVADRPEAVTRRYVLGCEPLPPLETERRLDGQRVVVLGSGPLATAAAAAIRGRGGEATIIEAASQQAAEAAIDRCEQAGPASHLLLLTAAEHAAGLWAERLDESIMAVFFACQRWLSARQRAGDLSGASLTAATRLGGDFGARGPVADAAGGGLAGLLKNLAHECAELQVRIVDHSAAATDDAVATATVAELCNPDGVVEVGYGANGRQRPVPVEQPAPAGGSGLEATAAGSLWLVTGGARGVTAACGLALGKRYGLRLVLVGSTEPLAVDPDWLERDDAGLRELKGSVMLAAKDRGEDPRAAWRTVEKSLEIARSLRSFQQAGVEARYLACDLSDPTAVRQLVAAIEQTSGPIRGLVHGAGYEAACRFEKKTAAGLSATLGPKAAGLEHLLAAIDRKSLAAVIGFGSTSGRFGGHGQADYSLANELLAKIAARLRHERGIPATVFHWHAWDEVGMASRPESRFVLEQFGLNFMPLAEGVERFLDEVAAGLPAAEVIVTEPAFCMAAGPVRAAGNGGPDQRESIRGSLVGDVEADAPAKAVSVDLDPTTDRFLVEHTQHGRPLLPAVMAAEILFQAGQATGVVPAAGELRDFRIERPLSFPTAAPRRLRVEIGPVSDGLVPAVGWAPMLNAAGQAAGEPRPHFSGRIFVGPVEPMTQPLDEPPFPFNPMVYREDAPLRHGPSFRTLSGLFLDRSGGWARLTAPDPNLVAEPRGAAGWTVPVALLDGCIVGCAVYSYILLGKRVEVPLQFERLRMVRQPQPGETCTLRLFYRSHDERESRYDFTLYGADRQPILAVAGLHLAVVPSRESR